MNGLEVSGGHAKPGSLAPGARSAFVSVAGRSALLGFTFRAGRRSRLILPRFRGNLGRMSAVAVAAPNVASAEAGEAVARLGGNAIDAALAAALATMVNEVGIVSLSSGGFITVQPPDGSAPQTVDGWVEMPGRDRELGGGTWDITTSYGGGVIVNVDQLPSDGLKAPLHLAVTRELTLTGSSRFYGELPAVLGAMADGSRDVAPIISDIYPLRKAEEAFIRAADASQSSKVHIDFVNGGFHQ